MVLIAFLQEITDIKESLLQMFLTDTPLVRLLTNKTDVTVPALDLRYTQVFPYHWLSQTVTEQKSFLCFSITTPKVQSPAIKDVEIKVWIFSHEGIMRTAKGPRIDLLSIAIDTLLNGTVGLGVGRCDLLSTREISPAKDFYGYELRYMLKDFNRSFRQMRAEAVVG